MYNTTCIDIGGIVDQHCSYFPNIMIVHWCPYALYTVKMYIKTTQGTLKMWPS